MPLLAFDHVSRTFTAKVGFFRQARNLLAVDDVSFALEAGQSLGLVGESGCGKSTLGKLACGLLPPAAGKIIFQGRDLPPAGAKSWAAGKIQMVFQDPASSLNPRMTILGSVGEPLAARGVPPAKCRAIAEELLAVVGLKDMGKRYPHQFSGGQRQRIAVARALTTRPDAIICDEPVSALDASVQAQILNLLRDLGEHFQPAYLFISHDLAVIGFMCPHIMVMYLGQIVEKGDRRQLFENPAHPYTQALLAAMPQGDLNLEMAEGIDRLPAPLPGELPSPLDPPSGCRFHPRCPKARTICATEAPPWLQLSPEWGVRCHFPG